MTDNVTTLPVCKPLRACHACGYVATQDMIEQARFDFFCPRCGKHQLSQFHRTTLTLENP